MTREQRGPANYNLILATVAFAVAFAVWSLISPLAPSLQKEFHLSDVAVSTLIAVPVLLGSVLRIPMGLLTDRYGGRLMFTLLLLFSAATAFSFMFASSFAILVLMGLLLGTAGSSFAIGVPTVSRWFSPKEQGLVLGIFGMGNIGTAVSARLAPALSAGGGWIRPFQVLGAVAAIMALIYWLTGRDAPRPAGPQRSIADRLSVLGKGWGAWLLSLYYFLSFGGFVALGAYLPKFLVDRFALDRIDAGNRTAGFVLVATLARPLGGWLADRFGGRRVLTTIFVIIPALAGVLATDPDMTVLTAAFLALAVCFGIGNGAVFKLVAEVYPKETGTVTGVVGAAGGLGGFFPPLVMGAVKQSTGSYALGFGFLATFAALCLLIHVMGSIGRAPTGAGKGATQ